MSADSECEQMLSGKRKEVIGSWTKFCNEDLQNMKEEITEGFTKL
jgi:hypothetical protein